MHAVVPPSAHLWSEAGYVKEVHVSEVSETDKCVFTVIFLSGGAEEYQGDFPHPTTFMSGQLELRLGAHFGEREHLKEEEEGRQDLNMLLRKSLNLFGIFQ